MSFASRSCGNIFYELAKWTRFVLRFIDPDVVECHNACNMPTLLSPVFHFSH